MTSVSATSSISRTRKRPRSEISDTMDPLHSVGYRVYRSAIKIKEPVLKEVSKKSAKGAAIFNHNRTKKNDFKRRETSLTKSKTSKCMKQFLGSLNRFVADKVSSTLTPSQWSVIYSKPGCQEQAPHCDFVPDSVLSRVPDEQMPLSVIVTLMPGTRLNVWPHSIRLASLNPSLLRDIEPIQCEVLELEPGDVLVFRGDFVHAGSSYKEDNYRLHTFLDSDLVLRIPNRTWTVQEDGDLSFRKLIVDSTKVEVQ